MQEIDLVNVKPELRKILLIGKEGSGKTHFLGTMPRPMALFSFDNGYRTLAGNSGIKVYSCMDADRLKPTAYKEFDAKFKQLCAGEKYKWSDGKEEAYQTIAIDSISFLSTFLFDYLQYINSNIDKPGGYAVYGQVKSKLQDIVNRAAAISENVVVTALLDFEKNELTGETFQVPSVLGSLKNEIGAWFDGVFFMDVQKKVDGAVAYKMLTVGSRQQVAKIRVPSISEAKILPVEEPDFRVISDKIRKAFEAK